MGRGKTEIKRIGNVVSRQVTFGKRRAGLLKKARELALLWDVDVGVLIFSDAGHPFDYCSPYTSPEHSPMLIIVKAPLILVGCDLDLGEEQQNTLEPTMTPIMQSLWEFDTCTLENT